MPALDCCFVGARADSLLHARTLLHPSPYHAHSPAGLHFPILLQYKASGGGGGAAKAKPAAKKATKKAKEPEPEPEEDEDEASGGDDGDEDEEDE
jgi:hypothetical protein